MTLRVAVVGTSWKSIPPNGYGGIENVVFDLITGSQELDISFSLFSVGETVESGKIPENVDVQWLFKKGMYPEITNEATKIWIEANHAMAAWEYVACGNIDVIHDHSGIGFGMIAGSCMERPPILTTLHGPLTTPLIQQYYRFLSHKPGIYFNSISYAQRRDLPEIPYLGNVYNGVNLDGIPFEEHKQDYLLILGRITPFKGQKEAVEAAKRLGIKLVIAGTVEQNSQAIAYWRDIERELSENIDGASDKISCADEWLRRQGDGVLYFGEADTNQKFELFKNARATLMPISWEEPFGLVMIESLATGTPVVGFNQGSVSEIISHGQNGFIVENTEEMISALRNIARISPFACRESVRERFSHSVMARAYHELYRKIEARRTPGFKSGE